MVPGPGCREDGQMCPNGMHHAARTGWIARRPSGTRSGQLNWCHGTTSASMSKVTMWRSRWRCVIKPAYSVSFLLSINIFVWQNVLYFPNDPRTYWNEFSSNRSCRQVRSTHFWVGEPFLQVLGVIKKECKSNRAVTIYQHLQPSDLSSNADLSERKPVHVYLIL